MPIRGLLALLDDVATVLDDIAASAQLAAQKTAGVIGDDLALNAQQVAGVQAERELHVIWGVAKGSAVNKAFLVPGALVISAAAPWLVGPLLVVGGAYLCFEGVEKIADRLFHSVPREPLKSHVADDYAKKERGIIRTAIRTDFILSAEIVVISLGVVADKPFGVQVGTLVVISALMTIGVYGLVAGIVRFDDVGSRWLRSDAAFKRQIGRGILALAPWVIRTLSVVGTLAMFLVGGSLVVHSVPPVQHVIDAMLVEPVGRLRFSGEALAWGIAAFAGAFIGLVVGSFVFAVVNGGHAAMQALKSSR
jgi:uncharacterized protein